MAKEIVAKVKLQCPGGQATPAPPVGPALGQHGVNIAAFVKQFNDRSRDKMGMTLPIEITIFKDKSFEFIIKSPPASVLIRTAMKIEKGAKMPGREKVGTVTRKQLEEVAKAKMNDLNAGSLEAAVRVVAGTARSMGVQVVD
ncbi:50S ribosomal protein L11 [bacterium]|nr:MAG: 50S ribosomal protein L11 [bacterium]MBV6515935.1 50S ribosomal protein L11 [Planctomycetota bacterium]NUO16525.1 50S ribosomal protein L11 [Planctomycetaceae bacterium]RIK64949.1 MAG: 50S ribosomal protein L11 [Planctomycetota bacterium]HRJ79153.1 50S ribosomal protein L11 [Planctomycetota bacterium]